MTTFTQFLADDLLTEAWDRHTGSSAILPASRVLFNKNAVTPNHASSEKAGVWHKGDHHVRTYSGRMGKLHHVFSSGHYHPDSKHEKTKVGGVERFHHDQTGRDMHAGHLLGVSNYKDGKKVSHHGEDHSETKAPLHVYK